ncbi:MAG: hypothetical protein M0C28_45755 [Candidatus Moduliflexus flocculans]|nr:hypothetical protein [Candidatus Moduliflexus flocculans]
MPIAASPACSGPQSRGHHIARHDQQPLILIPNIDDDNADGIPDVSAAPLAARRGR